MKLLRSALIIAVYVIVSSPLMAGGGQEDVRADEITRQNKELTALIKQKGLTESTVSSNRNLICYALYNKDLDSLAKGASNELKYVLLGIFGAASMLASGQPAFLGADMGNNARREDEAKIIQNFYWIDNVYLQYLKGNRTVVPAEINKNYAITVADVNMRYGPSVKNDRIKTIDKFSKVRIVNKTPINGWVKVKYEDDEGYVDGGYLNFDAIR